jgi:Na+/proline symporter
MSLTTIIIIVGILAIGALGMASRRRQKSASHWVVGKRDIPKWTTWFLQAGESLTTFSFLGLAGIAFGGGVSAVYAVAEQGRRSHRRTHPDSLPAAADHRPWHDRRAGDR